jgi:hypothetical protein
MSEYKLKPTRWFYVLAILLPIFACMGTALLVYVNVPELPGTLDTLSIHSLTQVPVPGSAEIVFPKSGAYAVYYEYRSVIDGKSYYRNENFPRVRCQLNSKETGKAVKLVSSNVEGNIYNYPGRAGVMFKQISIDQPGAYNFSCQYPDGRSTPKSVMAVGPNYVWEFFNIAVKPIAAMMFGALVFFMVSVISILIIVIVAVKRHRSKNILASQA